MGRKLIINNFHAFTLYPPNELCCLVGGGFYISEIYLKVSPLNLYVVVPEESVVIVTSPDIALFNVRVMFFVLEYENTAFPIVVAAGRLTDVKASQS